MRVFTGTSGYAYKEWKGVFYPEKTPAKDMLRAYGERLGCVEINNTFHRMPKESVLQSWAQQVPDDFVFALKAPQIITHVKRLKEVGGETEHLFKMLASLGQKLGPVLFQFPERFGLNHSRLSEFLELIPDGAQCAFAFRSASWHVPEVLDSLRAKGCCLCLEDTEQNPAEKIISAAPWGYLRLRRSDYSESDLERWAEMVMAQDWEKAFVFFKHEEEARGPQMAVRFREMVG